MIRTITIAKDDGSVIKTVREELQTERNWNRKFFKLRRNAIGEIIGWRSPYGNEGCRFFTDSEVLPMTTRENAVI